MKELRIEAGITAFQLAAKSGVSISTINRIETGKKPVKRLVASKVIRSLSSELGRPITLEDVQISLAD